MNDASPLKLKVVPEGGMRPSIWMHLPAELHHADTSIGSTGLKRLRVSPPEFYSYWPGNPQRIEDKLTDAKKVGGAIHLHVLEGLERLKERYAVEAGEEALDTMEEMKAFLQKLGKQVSGRKDDLIKRVQAFAPQTRIKAVEDARNKASGKLLLNQEQWDRTLIASKHIEANPHLVRSFRGGYSEISIFWIDPATHVRCHARFDYIRVVPWQGRNWLICTDLKSFAMPREIPIDIAINHACEENRLQIAHYCAGLQEMLDMLRDGYTCEDASPEELEWLKLVATCERIRFYLVFYKNSRGAYSDARRFEPEYPYVRDAMRDVETYLRTFRDNYDHFGDEIWVNRNEPKAIQTSDDVRPWLLGG